MAYPSETFGGHLGSGLKYLRAYINLVIWRGTIELLERLKV